MRSFCTAAAWLAGGALAAAGAGADDALVLRIEFAPPEIHIEEDPLTGADEFFGAVHGAVASDDAALFAGASVDCEFEGHTFESRDFSCGFTEAESVAGVCLFTAENGDAAVARWRCRTGATMTSDARCEGTAEWIEGAGIFAGIAGEAKIHADLFLYPTQGLWLWKGRWGIPRLAALAR